MSRRIDLNELQCELKGTSMIIVGLCNQLDNTKTDSLTAGALHDALYGVRSLIERVADDLELLELNKV